MNIHFLNPFIDAVVEVLKAETGITAVERGNLDLQKSALTSDEVTVIINMVGQVYGVVLYGMPALTAMNLVSSILGQPFSEFNGLAQSGVAELGNVITGRAAVNLSRGGYEVDISPPTVITGHGVQISTLDFARIVVPLKTEAGPLTVHLALRESVPGRESQAAEFGKLVLPATSGATK